LFRDELERALLKHIRVSGVSVAAIKNYIFKYHFHYKTNTLNEIFKKEQTSIHISNSRNYFIDLFFPGNKMG